MARKKSKKRKNTIRALIKAFTIAFLVAIAASAAWLYLRQSHPDKGAKIPEGDYIFGIDVSKYQSDINWKDLKILVDENGITTGSLNEAKETKRISYVFIKATEGTSLVDKCFKNHWKKARQANIRRGAYHFFRSSKDPEKQAQLFIKTVGKLSKDDLPPVLDIETIHDGCSNKVLNDKALIWLRTVEKHYGRKPIVYSNASFINNNLSKEIKDNYPIWVAHYKTHRPRCNRWHIWQFTDQAIVFGIEGNVDVNVTTREFLESI